MENHSETTFDYIIAGGGMAGLSLAFLLNNSSLTNKKILIIDREIKDQNDHTWCFWECEKGNFEDIVYRKWNDVWFHGTRLFRRLLNLQNYEYKMIRASDFYNFVNAELSLNSNITMRQIDVINVENGIVYTEQGNFEAREFVFDSTSRKTYDNPKYQNMWQHFLGFVVQTETDAFRIDEATLFDFRVDQKNECRFCYVLPISENEALIEFTIFSDNLPERSEYENELKKYISEILKIGKYEVRETEFGVIPMSDEPHDEFPSPKTIRIGTSGGYVKPSTGYSFMRTQKRLQEIVRKLELGEKITTFGQPWKSYMDSVFLNVLLTKKHPSDDVFTKLFENNEPTQVLKFLDEETNLAEDYRIMRSVPILAFSRAAIATIFRKLK